MLPAEVDWMPAAESWVRGTPEGTQSSEVAPPATSTVPSESTRAVLKRSLPLPPA